jgi:hypothetical protein
VSTRGRPELLEKDGQRQNLRLHILVQSVEFRLELVADLDSPTHCPDYDIDSIWFHDHIQGSKSNWPIPLLAVNGGKRSDGHLKTESR